MASNIPKHGDAIIEVKTDGFGGKKLVASFQFQRFLDELGVVSNNSDSETSEQLISALNLKNALLLAKIDNQEQHILDLEQLLYVHKG